jgi:hypothetical protein
MYAARAGHIAIVHSILDELRKRYTKDERIFMVDVDRDDKTVLHHAIERGNLEVLKVLLVERSLIQGMHERACVRKRKIEELQ